MGVEKLRNQTTDSESTYTLLASQTTLSLKVEKQTQRALPEVRRWGHLWKAGNRDFPEEAGALEVTQMQSLSEKLPRH